MTSLKTVAGKTTFYLTMAWMGAALSLAHLALRIAGGGDFWIGFTVGGLIVSLTVLLRRKLRDEYVERLWSAGTSAAFIVVAILFLLRPFVDGAFGSLTGAPWNFDITGYAMPIALLAFFAAFHAAHLRSRL